MMKIKKTKKESELIGMDISENSIHVVQLVNKGGKAFIGHFAKASFDENLGSREINRLKVLKEMLGEVKSEKKIIAIALSDTSVVIKKAMIDAGLKDEEILAWLSEEASRYFNESTGMVAIDFETQLLNDEGKQQVEWVMARQEEVSRKVSMVENMGLKVKIVDVNILCLQRVAKKVVEYLALDTQTIGFSHFDGQCISFIVVKHGKTIQRFSEVYQNTSMVEKILMRIINRFFLNFSGESLHHIFLSGEIFSVDVLNNNISIPISFVDPFAIFPVLQTKELDSSQTHKYILSLGLAMRIKDGH